MGLPGFIYPSTPYLSSATVTCTDSYAGTDPAWILEGTEDAYHRPADTTGPKTYDIDLAEARVVDCLGLCGQGLDGVVITLRGSTDDFVASDDLLLNAVNLSAPVNAAWQSFTPGSYRYFKLIVDSFGSYYRLAWAALGDMLPIPYFERDPKPKNISDTGGKALTSPAGLYLGTTQLRAMREMEIRFGQVDALDLVSIEAWAKRCIRTRNPFFLVPDRDQPEVFFGWTDSDFDPEEEAAGLYQLAAMKMTTRAL